jgi:hypothetical protein
VGSYYNDSIEVKINSEVKAHFLSLYRWQGAISIICRKAIESAIADKVAKGEDVNVPTPTQEQPPQPPISGGERKRIKVLRSKGASHPHSRGGKSKRIPTARGKNK